MSHNNCVRKATCEEKKTRGERQRSESQQQPRLIARRRLLLTGAVHTAPVRTPEMTANVTCNNTVITYALLLP